MTDIAEPVNRVERERFYNSLAKDPMARLSLELIVTVIFILFLFIIAIKPTIVTITEIQTNLENLQTFNGKLTTKIKTLKKLSAIFQDNQQRFALLDTAIPPQPEFTLFEKQLRYLIIANNFDILSLSFSRVPLLESALTEQDEPVNTKDKKGENDLSDKINVNLAANGSYESIKNFISQLQTLNRLVTINSFTISQTSDDNLNFAINATTYYGLKADQK